MRYRILACLCLMGSSAIGLANEKISFKVSGQINRALFIWDNGKENDIYNVNNASSRSRFQLKGDSKIEGNWSAGFTLEIGLEDSLNTFLDEDHDENGDFPGAPTSTVAVRLAAWHLNHSNFGRLTIGQFDGASRYYSGFADFSRAYVTVNGAYSAHWNENFSIINKAGEDSGYDWGDFGVDDMDIIRKELIRYDSPIFLNGFRLGFSGGENDFHDVILSWQQGIGDLTIAANVMYQDFRDGFDGQYRCTQGGPTNDKARCFTLGGTAGFQHMPSGLFLTYAGASRKHKRPTTEDSRYYFIKGGWTTKFEGWGKTSLYTEYYQGKNGPAAGADLAGDEAGVLTDPRLVVYGAGIVQWVDALGIEVYLAYRNYTLDAEDATGTSSSVKAFDAVQLGSRIKF